MRLREFDILWEDNHLMVVQKAVGLSCQQDQHNPTSLPLLVEEFLCVRERKPGRAFVALVQRLDKMTSGVMVLAKTSKAAKRLNEQFQSGRIKKRYLALTDSRSKHIPARGIWVDFLQQDKENYRARKVSHKQGKMAKLCYHKIPPLQTNIYTVFMVRTYTGRYHQIRIQFAERDLPIWGDAKYGFAQKEEGQRKKQSRLALKSRRKRPPVGSALSRQRKGHPSETMRSMRSMPMPSLGLHSCQLDFFHPITQKRLHFSCPPPLNWPRKSRVWFRKKFKESIHPPKHTSHDPAAR